MMSLRTRMIVGAALLSCVLLACVALLKNGVYGWTIFIVIPMCAGGLASCTFRPQTSGAAIGIGALTGVVACGSLLFLGLEGIICVGMALPVVVPLSIFGSWVIYRSIGVGHKGPMAMALLLPFSFLFDVSAKPPVYSVRTSIIVNARPERVWNYVTAFPDIPGPTDWVFRTGIAYPERTRIEGTGVGAARYCDLSTGSVVERVIAWDEPRMLRFVVTSTAPAMREKGLYGDIYPKHLTGYFVSKQGQFTLTPLAHGRTLLEGTSWYQHGLWPAEYWRLWSDAIVHRIHRRVLDHIRILSESSDVQ